MGCLIAGVIFFIQSAAFARTLRSLLIQHLPQDGAIEADFTDLSVKMFPPGLSIRNPRIYVRKPNIFNLPPDSSVQAERIDFIFLPFQMLSGNIRVREVAIVKGNVKLSVPSSIFEAKKSAKSKSAPLSLAWEDLLQVRTDAVSLQETRLTLEKLPGISSAGLFVPYLRVGQSQTQAARGYEVNLELNSIEGGLLTKYPGLSLIWRASAIAHINAMGVAVDSATVVGDGFETNASGHLTGNILLAQGLGLEGNVNLSGDAGKILRALETVGAKVALDGAGTVTLKAKVKAELDNLAGTLSAEGEIAGHDLEFAHWKADQLQFKGDYANGWLNVASLAVSQAEQERVGGFQPGKGGKLNIGAFKFPLFVAGNQAPVQIPLKLERAHLHWLGAGALKQVYPISLRATGPLDVTFFPATREKPWSLLARSGLKVENFLLDNQRLGKVKPLKHVLQIPKFDVTGDVIFDASGFRPTGLILALPNTRLQMGGKVDFKTGFDLTGAGIIKLEDIHEIGENEIRGNGTLSAHVHGPSNRVLIDFDTNLQEASYLHMNFGDFQGRITWDDDPNILRFTKIQLARGKSVYHANGVVDLDHEGTVDMDVAIPSGDVQDFIQVFSYMTQDLWWFPKRLNGPVEAVVKIRGGIEMKKLEVLAKGRGTNWEYLGERFKTITFDGGFDKGRYYLENLIATKHQGGVTGRISYTEVEKAGTIGAASAARASAPEGTVDWDFQTQDFLFSDIDHISQLDIPLRGKLNVHSVGKGATMIASSTSALMTDVALKGRPLPASSLTIKSESHSVQVAGNALGGQGTTELVYDLNPNASSSLRMDLHHLDFSPIVLLINPSLLQDERLAGFISGGLSLRFHAGQLDRSTGQLDLGEYLLAKSGARFELVRPVSVKVADGSFDLRGLGIKGNTGEAELNLQGHQAGLEGQVQGQLDLSIVEFLTSSIQKATGLAQLDFVIGGTLREPNIYGRATLEGVGVQVAALESPFENVAGILQLKQNVITVRNLDGELAGGRVAAEGTVFLLASSYPRLNLKGTLSGNRIKIFPFQYARVRGALHVHGDELPYSVDGSLAVDSALCKEKVLQQKKAEGPKTLQYTPGPNSQTESSSTVSKFKLNIEVAAEKDILVKNDLFDAEFKGKLRIVNTLEAPRVLGNAELIQGRLIFKDRIFNIQSASGTFDNPTTINPSFNLTASTDVNGTKIQLYAAGRLNSWKPELTSNPVMAESEILSLLALGITANEAKRFSAGDRSAIEQGEAASLLLNSLDFNREVQNKTGFQIQLDESVNTQTGTSAFRPQSQSETTAAPKIVIRKKVGDRLTLSAGSTVGVGTNQQKEVNAEFHVNPGFSVIGVFDQTETVDAQDRKSMGVDLKWQTRFK